MKTPWIFLRGLVRESGHWGSFTHAFESGVKDSQVICLDLPGTGVHYRQTSPITIDGIVNRLRSEYVEKVTEPGYLFTISLGAMAALNWVTRFPKDFKGVVLINTSLPKYSPVHHRLRPPAIIGVLKAAIMQDTAKREAHILSLVSNMPDTQKEVLADWIKIQTLHPVSKLNAINQLLAATTFRPPDHAPQVPTLFLSSAADKFVNPECTLEIVKRWGSPHYVHPTAGHELPLDAPQWVIEQVNRWLVSVS